jgi:hypothetical protein
MGRYLERGLAQVGSTVISVLRCEPRTVRWMPAALLVIAVGLSAWIFELGAVLEGQAEVRNWSSVWVGLDILEVVGLVATALTLRRRSSYLSAVAGATAALFALDAWFDVLTAQGGAAWYESLASAIFAELPIALVLGAISAWSAKRAPSSNRG